MSLRSRLVAGMVGVAAVLIVVCVALTVTIRSQLIEQVDDRLQSLAPGGGTGRTLLPGLQEFLANPPNLPNLPTNASDATAQRVSDIYQGFVTPDGKVITFFAPNFQSGDAPIPALDADQLDVGEAETFNVESTDGSTTYRVLVRPLAEFVSVTGVPIDGMISTINRLIWLEVVGSLTILVVLALVSWRVVHFGIRPIKTMTETATRIAAGDLGVRVPEVALGTESGDLAAALNTMLGSLEQSLEERTASQERLRRFVADASHELRTPVTSILGYAELYRAGGLREDDALDDAMRRTQQEAARMGRLINDMLALARLDEQRPLAQQPVDLAQLCRDSASDARAAAPERTILVDAAEPNVVVGDEDQLRQVMANLVSNALVHTDGAISLRSSADGALAAVEVTDTGAGMPPEVVERVTERFFRADPARSRQRGGSGLGLAIADAAVSAHGGRIDITSKAGVGTTVRLTIPRHLT